MRPYEIVYVLDSTLEREAVDEKLDSFHAVLGGEITAVDHWGVRQLAYPIRKSKTAYYVIVQVTTNPDALPEFERLLRLDEETMRYLIVLNEGQPTSGASVLADRPALQTRRRSPTTTRPPPKPGTKQKRRMTREKTRIRKRERPARRRKPRIRRRPRSPPVRPNSPAPAAAAAVTRGRRSSSSTTRT